MKTRNARNVDKYVRLGVLIVLVALCAIPLYTASSASSGSSGRVSIRGSKAVANGEIKPARSSARTDKHASELFGAVGAPTSLLPQPPPPETIATFEVVAGACTATPKNSFNLGETVCAVITGAPLGTVDRAASRIGWVSPYGSLAQGADITTDPQNGFYMIPATATQIFTDAGGGTVTVDNRGTWRVGIYSAADGSLRETALFTVHDPAKAFVDLSVSQAVGSQVNAGSGGAFEIFVTNNGPDAAQDVVLTDNLSDNATFSSVVENPPQLGFSCGTPVGTVFTCNLASMPAGTTAHLTLSYTVNGDTPTGASITNTASVASSATPCSPDASCELQPNDNSSTVTAEVPTPTGTETCTLTCHLNFSVVADAFQEPGHVHGSYVFFGAANGNGSCGAIDATFNGIPDTVPATDPPSHIPASGAFYPVGTTVIHVSSATGGGSCSFTITVVEGTPPTISCPPDQSATASTPGGPHTFTAAEIGSPTSNPTGLVVSFERSDNIPATYDANGNVVTPEVVYSLTDPFPSGTTGINWTVTDSNGLAASCTQRILVHDPCATDTEPPTITAPPAVTVNTGPNSTTCGVALSPSDNDLGTPVVHDDCSASVSITGIPAGNLFPVGDTTLTYTATDGAGHTASDTQLVRVIDNTVPVIVAPADASYTCLSEVPAGSPAQAHGNNPNLPNGGPVFDNCGSPTVTVSDSSTGAGSVASPRIITRTYTATDTHSNSANAVQIITVIDPTPPTFTSVPGPVTAYTGTGATSCSTVVSNATLGTATATDNCSVTVTRTGVPAGNVFPVGPPTDITYTATDGGGNTAVAHQLVTVVDDTPPTIISVPAGGQTDAGSCTAAIPDVATGTQASDNCGVLSKTQNPVAGTAVGLGPHTITVTVTDVNGNSSQAQTTFTVNALQFDTRFWLGLKNSDDVGTKFDLRAEVRKNNVLVGSAEIYDQSGGSSGFNNATERSISAALSSTGFCTGDKLDVTLLVRIASSSPPGHLSGTARLWYNDSGANSRFNKIVNGGTTSYYLRNISNALVLDVIGTSQRLTIDVLVNKNQNGNAFKPFGTWTKTF